MSGRSRSVVIGVPISCFVFAALVSPVMASAGCGSEATGSAPPAMTGADATTDTDAPSPTPDVTIPDAIAPDAAEPDATILDAGDDGAPPIVCSGESCAAGLIAEWRFEDDLTDTTGKNSASADGAIEFELGYAGKAASFTGGASAFVTAPVGLELRGRPRTVEAWYRATSYGDVSYNGLLSWGPRLCDGTSQVLAVQSNGRLSSAQWCDDVTQTAGLVFAPYSWHHAAFTYDGTTRRLYMDGEEVAAGPGPLDTRDGVLCIGATDDPGRRWNGWIDEARIAGYAKSADEIRDEATRTAVYDFDGADGADKGPNRIVLTEARKGAGVSFVGDRGAGKALALDGTANGYWTAFPLWSLGTPNRAYTIMARVKPTSNPPRGVIAHVSDTENGFGGQCFAPLGLTNTGRPEGSGYGLGGIAAVTAANAISPNEWTHLAVTWSSNVGLTLYVDGKAVGTTGVLSYATSNGPMYLTLGSPRDGGTCDRVQTSMVPFQGAIDDFHVFSRALSPAEVAASAK